MDELDLTGLAGCYPHGRTRVAAPGLSKADLAARMHTSRAQVDRILNAKTNVTIETLQRAAALVGKQLRLEIV